MLGEDCRDKLLIDNLPVDQLPSEMVVITLQWTGLNMSPEAAEEICHHTEGDFRLIVGYLVDLEKACEVGKTKGITKEVAETVVVKNTKRRATIDRHRRDRTKKLFSVGRKQISEGT